MVAISKLAPYARNSRTHSPEQVELIVQSIEEFGFTNPVLIDEQGNIIAGHGRVMAAQKMGMASVPCVEIGWMTEEQRRAYVIADNQLAARAGWDTEILKLELRELDTAGFDLSLIGFDGSELASLLKEETKPQADPDDVPEPPADPITKPGDLWILGEHRLLCGDSTKIEDVERLMAGQKADMMFTDPPYGVSYVGKTKKALTIQNDGEFDLPKLLDGSFAGALFATRAGACWYVAAPPGPQHWEFAKRLMNLGVYRQTLVWVKDALVLGHSDYHYKHEPIFYGWKPGASHHDPPDRMQTSVWEFARPKRSEDHPTMKPVELVAKAIGNSSALDQLIYDPFLGSGTTLIAAEQLGRKCYGVEISPQYCDVIVKRWENYTGKKAELEHGASTN